MLFEERKMWRLLLARLHPDAGGDEESFLLAAALRTGIRGELPLDPETTGNHSTTFLRPWRGAMDSWASDNRNSLKGNRTRCNAPSRP